MVSFRTERNREQGRAETGAFHALAVRFRGHIRIDLITLPECEAWPARVPNLNPIESHSLRTSTSNPSSVRKNGSRRIIDREVTIESASPCSSPVPIQSKRALFNNRLSAASTALTRCAFWWA